MVKLKPWYRIDGLRPRADLREGKPLDAAEFAVHLDQVRDRRAPADYQEPQRFFERTYLTKYLTDLAAQVVRRLSGEKTGTSAVFNLSTQFGGGKTHTLTLLYHLAKSGPTANQWTGVSKILQQAEVSTVPEAAVAVFVGTEFDSITGRGGDNGTPKRKTPWGELAYQLGGEEAFAKVAQHEAEFIEPKGDVIRSLLPKDKPCLILMDEIINYVSTYRKKGYHNSLYNFIQALSETARGMDNVVLVVSIPASEMEYTEADERDEQRYKKMLDRLGKAVVMSAESETSEIIRRRLFEWDEGAISGDGKIMLPREAVATCNDYADWVISHRQQLPNWFPVDHAQDAFKATYPFHPTVLSVFERKWQVLPRFQRTRGVLRLLALWVSHAYQQGYKGAHRDPLIGLGTAPLDDPLFRTAVFEQLGENRLEGAVTTDICGKPDSHAVRLDREAVDAIKKSRLHRKAITTIFFESNGGQLNTEATVPEIRLATAEPELDIVNVETVLDSLSSECYYLNINRTKYRFSTYPNLNKILADRRANIASRRIDERIQNEIRKVFLNTGNTQIVYFPKSSSDLANQPLLTVVVLSPDDAKENEQTQTFIDRLIREAGSSGRTYKSALIFVVADSDIRLREESRKLLAWEDIRDQENRLNADQQRQLSESIKKSQRDLTESVWRTYKYIALLGQDNQVNYLDLGLVNSSQDSTMTSLVINHLRKLDEVQDTISPRFLTRNWSPAFFEWSTKSVRDAFFASPQLPRLLNPNAIKEAIACGVREGSLAYVGKTEGNLYDPFEFKTNLSAKDIEISDTLYIIKGEEAQAYEERIKDPPKLTQLNISPASVQLEPGKKQAFNVEGFDQYEQKIPVEEVQWSATGGIIDEEGVLEARNDEGNFTVTATVEGVSAQANLTIFVPKPNTLKEKGADYTSEEIVLNSATGLSWQGEITPQKWMQFYLKVLSKFATDSNLQMKLEVKVTVEGNVSNQKSEETKSALAELGLDDNVEIN